MAHHIIYIPGIGDERPLLQDKGIGWWRIFGIKPHYHPVGWLGHESFSDKLTTLLTEIDSYLVTGDTVSLIGFSAGASAALNAFVLRKNQLSAVVCISGKINHPVTAGNYFRRQPALSESLYRLQPELAKLTNDDKSRLLTLNPIMDAVVAEADAILPGVPSWRIVAFSHVMSIIVSLTMYAPFIVWHCRRLAKVTK